MIQREILDIKSAAELLGMSQRKAKAFLKDHGLEPFDVCTSERHGRKVLRWSRLAVMSLIDTLQTGAKPSASDIIPRRKDSISILGKSPKEVYAMYARWAWQ